MIRFSSLSNYPQAEQPRIIQAPKPVPISPKLVVLTKKKIRKPCKRRLYDRAELTKLRAEGWGYIRIGRLYDKHHTTILHACRKWGIK